MENYYDLSDEDFEFEIGEMARYYNEEILEQF